MSPGPLGVTRKLLNDGSDTGGWTVLCHGFERDAIFHLAPLEDADAVLDARTHPDESTAFTEALGTLAL